MQARNSQKKVKAQDNTKIQLEKEITNENRGTRDTRKGGTGEGGGGGGGERRKKKEEEEK